MSDLTWLVNASFRRATVDLEFDLRVVDRTNEPCDPVNSSRTALVKILEEMAIQLPSKPEQGWGESGESTRTAQESKLSGDAVVPALTNLDDAKKGLSASFSASSSRAVVIVAEEC